MQDLKHKKILQNQERVTSGKKFAKNQDRVIFPNAFSPGKKKKNSTTLREEAEGRALSAMLLLVVFGVVMFLITIVGDYGPLSTFSVQQKQENLLAELVELRQQKSLLQKEVTALRHNPQYIEWLARRELGLVHPKERIFYLPQSLRFSEEIPASVSPFQ